MNGKLKKTTSALDVAHDKNTNTVGVKSEIKANT